jgi:cell division septation protein DedD
MKKNKKVPLPKKPSLILSRKAMIGWGCFIFFVCAWMFVIGVLVGRGTAPVKFDIDGLQKKLEAARKDLTKKEQLRTQGKSGVVKDKTKLDFYEALSDNRDDSEIDKKKPSPLSAKKKESSPEKKPPKKSKRDTEKRVVKKTETPKTGSAKSSRKPPSGAISRPRPSGKVYTIQVASVKNARDADRLVAKLKKKGFNAYRAIGKVPGKGIWYRVRVGEYKSKTSATSTLNKLKRAGQKPLMIEK